MKWPTRIFNFYLDASIHVAMAVFSLIQVTGVILKIQIDRHLAYFVFCGTIVCYNFIKYGAEAKKYVVVAGRYHKNIQAFSLVVLVIALYHARFLSFKAWEVIVTLFVLTALYALPVLPKAKNLRSLGILKIVLVALVWSGTTVILPCMEAHVSIGWDACMEALQRLVMVFILLIPFEVRDMKYDPPGLGTLPQRFGSTNAKSIGAFASVVFFFLTFLKDKVTLLDAIGKGVLFLVLGVAMFLTKREQSKYFASFWIEAIPMLWWGILLGLVYFS